MRRSPFYFVLALQTVAWVSATTTNFAPNDSLSPHKPAGAGPIRNSLQLAAKEEGETLEEEEEEAYRYGGRGKGKIGSSRPSCDHKCFGCNPCEAIQVPTFAGLRDHVAVQYTNYEPEGWKCKCGPSFFTP